MIEYLEPVIYEARQWQAKNCLVKLMLNRRKVDKIKNLTEGMFREIIKYAGIWNNKAIDEQNFLMKQIIHI